jgi:hypothetical protein
MEASQSTPSFRLLLHSSDGCVPHLTPSLLDQIFCADATDPSNTEWTWYRDHLILGLAATDTCITPVYSNQQKRNDGETHPKKKRKINHVDDQVGPSNDGDDADNKSHDAKKPSGYTFLTPTKTRAICNAVNSNSTDGNKSTDIVAPNYIRDYLRVPSYIRTMVVPTFSFVASAQTDKEDTKKFTSSKQSLDGSNKARQQQQTHRIKQQPVPKGTQNSVAINTPHGWQSITPEQYSGAVASLAYPNEEATNDVGAVGLFDHLNITAQVSALFSKDDTNEISTLKKQALKKITASLQKCITWSSRIQKSMSSLNYAVSSLWVPINIFTTFLPEHVLSKQDSLVESPNVAIVGWEAFPTNLHHIEKRKVLNKLVNTIRSMSSSEILPAPKQVLLLAVNDVASILVAAREGVSVIGTDLARILSAEGKALELDLTSITTVKTDQSAAHDNEGGILDLNDTNYAQDSQPILKGCTCLTCRPRKVSSRPVGYRHFQKEAADEIDTPAFSRAYIHHLIRAKEMLANTLLFIHNLHQLVMLFHKLSDARAASKLETFCDFVESQL